MNDRVMLITGASQGIGAACARQAAGAGYRLVLTYHRQQQMAQTLVDQLRANGAEVLLIGLDVADEQQVVGAFEMLDQHAGRIDVLVNNAGVLEQQTRFESISAERLKRVFAVNVFGSFMCAREAVTRMSTRHRGRGGAIVNLSSGAARLGAPGEYIDYAASKGAIESMTIGLAREVADQGIRVNAVRPGLIDTAIHALGGEPGRVERLATTVPMQRGGTADEVARAILWLASDEASYTTGAILDVAGGR